MNLQFFLVKRRQLQEARFFFFKFICYTQLMCLYLQVIDLPSHFSLLKVAPPRPNRLRSASVSEIEGYIIRRPSSGMPRLLFRHCSFIW
jgi:hypothetical protein